MRSSEFINEGFVDAVKGVVGAIKAPVGIGTRLTQWAGSKLPGGAGANATGQRETSQSVNNAKKAVMQFAGRIGKKITELTPDDVRNSQLVGPNSDKTWDEAVKALKLDPTMPFGSPLTTAPAPATPATTAPAPAPATPAPATPAPAPATPAPATPAPATPATPMTEDDAPAPATPATPASPPNPGNADKQLNALLLKYTQLVQKYAGTDHNQNTPVDLQHFVITSTKEQATALVDSLTNNTALTDKVMAAYLLELKKMQLVNVQQYEKYIAALRKQAGLPAPVARQRPADASAPPAQQNRQLRLRTPPRRRRPRPAATATPADAAAASPPPSPVEENLRAKYTEFLRES